MVGGTLTSVCHHHPSAYPIGVDPLASINQLVLYARLCVEHGVEEPFSIYLASTIIIIERPESGGVRIETERERAHVFSG